MLNHNPLRFTRRSRGINHISQITSAIHLWQVSLVLFIHPHASQIQLLSGKSWNPFHQVFLRQQQTTSAIP
ncbi:hypothetical protein D3C73_734370 [compost metagenome]